MSEEEDRLSAVLGVTRDGYLAVLDALLPRTAFVELAYANGLDDDEWELQHVFDALPLLGEKRVNEWPGTWSKPAYTWRRYRYDRSIFAAFREQEGFFVVERGPDGGDRTRRTGFGCVDVIFRDADDQLIAFTTTHEGILCVDDETLAAIRPS